MKPGDLVKIKTRSPEDKGIGVILGIRVSDTDFHDTTRSKPYVYANILWGKIPDAFMVFGADGRVFELSVDVLEVVT